MKRYVGMLLCLALAAGCANKSKPDEDESVQKSMEKSEEAEEATEESETEEPDESAETHGHEHGHSHQHGGHRFDEPQKYAKRWNDPARNEWQKPEEVIGLMEIEKGMTVADIGTGTGYFVPFLSAAVGPEGKVWALDIEPKMVAFVNDLAAEEDLKNVEAKKVKPDDPVVTEVDRFLTVNTWHHIGDREAYAARLASSLNEGGSVTIVDYSPDEDLEHGPPKRMRLPAEKVVAELDEAGFDAQVVEESLPRQYIVVGVKK